jgi:hypothetical protein
MRINPRNEYELKKGIKHFEKLCKGNVPFEVTKKRKRKSVSNNSYLHVCITLFAIEYGYNLEEAKTLLKRNCYFMVYVKNGSSFLKRVRDMDDAECADFTTWIRNYSSKQGLYIPTPEEYVLNQYEIDKQINNHKEYL